MGIITVRCIYLRYVYLRTCYWPLTVEQSINKEIVKCFWMVVSVTSCMSARWCDHKCWRPRAPKAKWWKFLDICSILYIHSFSVSSCSRGTTEFHSFIKKTKQSKTKTKKKNCNHYNLKQLIAIQTFMFSRLSAWSTTQQSVHIPLFYCPTWSLIFLIAALMPC